MTICKARLLSILAEWEIDLVEVDFSRLQEALHELPLRVAVPVIKTYFNSWATSSRYRETVRNPCIFGCLAPDNLRHYLLCECLWSQISAVTKIPMAEYDPIARLGLIDFSLRDFQSLVLGFHTYHALKHSGQVNDGAPQMRDTIVVDARLLSLIP